MTRRREELILMAQVRLLKEELVREKAEKEQLLVRKAALEFWLQANTSQPS